MRFPQTFLDELFARTSITDVVGKRVIWDKRKSVPARRDMWACCPFHGEKSSSFHVQEDKGRYYCFGCQKKGNAIDFLMEMDRLSFPEAVEKLAGEVGLTVPERVQVSPEALARRKGARDVLEAAHAHFQHELRGPKGAAARAYLLKRGLAEKVWAQFGLGYAPDSREALKHALEARELPIALQIEAGLLAEPEGDGPPYDRFRDRIMFPIADARGQLISFGGRAMAADARAKYLNGPETDLFSKGRSLYRLAEARANLARNKDQSVVVAEGYMDVIALERAGFAAVAPLGTAITEEQLALLWRLVPEPILCLDGDKAGLAAASRALDRALPLLEPGRSLRFAFVPDGLDPDDMLRDRGVVAFREVLNDARPLAQVMFERERDAEPLNTPERRAGLAKRLRELVARIANTDVREAYRQDVQQRLDEGRAPSPRQPWTAQPKSRTRRDGRDTQSVEYASAELKAKVASRRPPRFLKDIVSAPLGRPTLLEGGAEAFASLEIADPGLDSLRHALLDAWSLGETLDPEGVRRHLDRHGAVAGLAALEEALVSPVNPYTRPYSDSSLWINAMETMRTRRTLSADAAEARKEFAAEPDQAAFARLKGLVAERHAQTISDAEFDPRVDP